MFSIKIEAESLDHLIEQTQELLNSFSDGVPTKGVTVAKEIKSEEKPEEKHATLKEAMVEESKKPVKKKAPKKKAPAKTTVKTAVPQVEEPKKDENAPSLQDVIAALSPVNDQLGKEVAREILKEFKVIKISSIPENKRADFIKYCKETLESAGQTTEQEDIFN